MNNEEFFLIYINIIGKDWKGNYNYEFLFSDNIDDVDGEEWDEYPASGKPEPPHKKHIHVVGKLQSELKFDVIQNSDTFSVWDAVDGIISLGWEDISEYDNYPETRMAFKFGETLQTTIDVLYEQDIILEVNEVSEHERIEKED